MRLFLMLACLAAAAQTVQQTYVKASNTETTDRFGLSVAISGNTMVVGAPLEDSSAAGVNGDAFNNVTPDSGAAYVYVREGSAWSLQAYLKSSNPAALHQFGTSVAISGDTIVVGAPFENGGATGVNGDQNNISAIESGAAYVFVRNGTTWTQQAYLKASNTGASDQFGSSVAISGNTIVVGAPLEDSATGANPADNSRFDAGAAYVFFRTGTTWAPQGYLKASNPGLGDAFGISVAVSGDTIAIGASDEDSNGSSESDESAPDSGAAYVFTRTGSTWAQQAYIKASNAGSGDSFGAGVALAGNTLAVGAFGEGSNATGINGNQNNNLAPFSGAAYVFVRTGIAWTQQAYVKPSNTRFFSGFGAAVALSDQNLVVGAGAESTTANDSGAAYWFQRTGTAWAEKAFLKAAFPGVEDAYGFSVAVSGGLAASGAYFEDSAATGVGGDQQDNTATDSGAAYVLSLGNAKTARIATYTSGVWAVDLNGNFLNENGAPDRNVLFSLGSSQEIPLTGDWNGDGALDAAVYLNGTWLIDANGNGVWDGPATDKLIYFGGPGYVPYAGDWNGDGKSEIAVHLNGSWLIDFNGNFAWDGTPTDRLLYFGGPGYTPYVGRWGTSTNDSVAVHLNGTWLIDLNGNFQWDGPGTDGLLYFGGPGYTPVTGDWNGDGKTDLAAFLNGTWIVDFNGNYAWDGTVSDRLVFFGGAGFTPVSGDWNGDGKDKVGAFSAGTWVLDRNGSYGWDGTFDDLVTVFGTAGSVPLPGKWN